MASTLFKETSLTPPFHQVLWPKIRFALLFGFWLFGSPLAFGMAGKIFWWPLWFILGGLALYHEKMIGVSQRYDGGEAYLKSQCSEPSRWFIALAKTSPIFITLIVFSNLFLLGRVIYLSQGGETVVLFFTIISFLFYEMFLRKGGWKFKTRYLIPVLGYGLLNAVYRFQWLDITLSLWAWCLFCLWLGGLIKAPRVFIFTAFISWLAGGFFMEFYVDPMASQPQQVVVNNKIKILRSDPNLDFRWAQEGCEKGDYWMGTRRMMGIGPDETTLQKNNRGWKIGSGTADNGIVDCRIRIVMVGDQDQDNGRLTIFDEIHNKTIWHSPRRQGREWGYTGVVYHPGMGLLLGSMENAWRIDLVSVTKIPKTKHKYLEFPATHLTVCESMLRPCFFSANQNSIRRFEGPDFKQTHFRYRFGRGAGPILALDEKRNHLYSSDYFFGDTEVLNSKTLNSLDLIDFPMGTRYLLYWKKKDVLIAANFFDGYLYSFQKEKGVRKLIFAGRKVRWVNLTRDENGLLWCAASACYEWRPKNIDLIN